MAWAAATAALIVLTAWPDRRAHPAISDETPTVIRSLAGLDLLASDAGAPPLLDAVDSTAGEGTSPDTTTAPSSAGSDSIARDRAAFQQGGSARPSATSRFAGMARNFGSDLWHVASSPARINAKGALYTAGVLAVTGVLYAYDEDIAAGFHRSHENPTYRAVMEVGDFIEPAGFMPNALLVEGAGALVGYAFHVEPLRQVTMEMIESHLIDGGIRNVSKILIGRRREFEGKGAHFFELNGGTSFPSGHTSVIFEAATIASHHARNPVVTGVAYGLAGVLGLQRVHSTQHWPSDVFLSAVTGTLVGRVVVHRNEERRGRDAPVIGLVPAPGGVAVTMWF